MLTVDALWFFIAMYLWNQKASHDEYIWESLSGLHKMALFFSFINLVTRVRFLWEEFHAKTKNNHQKGGVIGILYMVMKEGEQAQPMPKAPPKLTAP